MSIFANHPQIPPPARRVGSKSLLKNVNLNTPAAGAFISPKAAIYHT